ncbi:Hypothetical predicted protein [Paramuricea clavata]|uniref:Uncharacterized protein n=1 Tax=Paramuricea clavata TaxID=317549 RepID=A0A6S7JFS0_PARCT|nr:Hypothetical predicted protein [Paramuricea clavata]
MERTEKGDTDRKQGEDKATVAEEDTKSTKTRAVVEANSNLTYENYETSKNSECGDSKNYSQAGESDRKINDDSEKVRMERTEKGDTDRKQGEDKATVAEEDTKSTKTRAVVEANSNLTYENYETSKNSECGDSRNYSQAGESDRKINDDSEKGMS